MRRLIAILSALVVVVGAPPARADEPSPADPSAPTPPTPTSTTEVVPLPTPNIPSTTTTTTSPSPEPPTDVVKLPDFPGGPSDEPPSAASEHTEVPKDNVPESTGPAHNLLRTYLLTPHLSAPVESLVLGTHSIPSSNCSHVRHSAKATPAGGGPSHATSHVSC